MPFTPPFPKEEFPAATVERIRSIKGSIMTSAERDPEWDKALEARVAQIPGCSELIRDLNNDNIARDRSRDEDIKRRFNSLQSDVERIAVFGAGTRVDEDKIDQNKPRLKAIFLFLGPEFQKAHKRAKEGNEIKPFSISDRLTADRIVRFTSRVK